MSGIAWAAPGAIWTSLSNGQTVNSNLYDHKEDVYLNGGPNGNGGGLPNGDYYFMVTDPSGAVLLSMDDVRCRAVHVISGRIHGFAPVAQFPANSHYPAPPAVPGCSPHANGGTDANGAVPVQLIPYADTPNNGGEYKVWLTPQTEYNWTPGAANWGFDGDQKSDNFKVRSTQPAYVVACKFNDLNNDGQQIDTQTNSLEPMIPGWPITATGVDGGPVNGQTGNDGCISFTVTSFPRTITLSEGNLDPNTWTQTTPISGSVGRSGNSPAYTVSAGVVTTTDLQPGDVLEIDFGNWSNVCPAGHCEPPDCLLRPSPDCPTPALLVTKTANPSYKITWGLNKAADQTEIHAASSPATAHYTITVTHDQGSNFAVAGNIQVTNLTTVTAFGVNLSDDLGPNWLCNVTDGANLTITSSDIITKAYNCTNSQLSAPPQVALTNTATASWTTPFGTGSASGTAAADFNSAVVVDGSANITDPMAPGGTVGSVNYGMASPITLTYTAQLAGTPGRCVDVPNTATLASFTPNSQADQLVSSATVKVCIGKDVTVEKTAVPTFKRTYNWKVEKTVDTNRQNISGGTAEFNYTLKVTELAPTDSDWKVTGVITVTNPNAFQAMSVNVADSLPTATCTVDTPILNVAASSTASTPYSCTYASAPPAGPITNTANVTWNKDTYTTPTGAASGTAPVVFGAPTTTVNKVVTLKDVFGSDAPVEFSNSITATDPPAAPTVATFTYKKNLAGSPGTCTSYSNTATYTTNDTPTATGSASQTVQVCVGVDLSVSKTATPSFKRAYTWSLTKNVDNTHINTSGTPATFNYTVTATQTGQSDSGWRVVGMITVTNPNDWEDVVVNLADAIGNGGTCNVNAGNPIVTVPKKVGAVNGSLTVPYRCDYAAAPTASAWTNTVTATWNAATFGTPTGSSTGNASGNFDTPTATLYKTITVTDAFNSGAPTTLGTLTATDPPAAPATATYTYPHVVGSPAGTCTTYPNTATLASADAGFVPLTASRSVEVCAGANLLVSKTVTSSFGRTYNWTLTKEVDQTRVNIGAGGVATFNYVVKATETSFTDGNWQVSGTIKVENPNTWQAVTVTLGDTLDNGGTCVVNGGVTTVIVPVKTGSTNGVATVPYSCTYSGTPSATTFTNTASATWDKDLAYTTNNSASGTAGGNFNTPNATKNATIQVTDNWNGSGVVTLGTATAVDSPLPKTTSFPYTKVINNAPVGTCTTYNNTAVLSGTLPGDTASATASQSVMVCVGGNLTIQRSVLASYDRIYTWSIDKTVDRTLFIAGGTANYDITVTQTGVSDGNYVVQGTITVTNPNDWESISLNLSATVDNGGVCGITGGPGLTLAAFPAPTSTATVAFTCNFSTAPSLGSFGNIAVAVLTGGILPNTTYSASGSGSWVLSGTTNQTISVTDVMNSSTTILGTATGTNAAPFTVAHFPFSVTIPPPPNGGCAVTNNTATIVQTGQSDSAQVSSCAIAGHTIGFWQNKNGQKIIDDADQVALGNWLRQFAPFADAPNTGTPGAIGNWFDVMFNTKSCAGSTCNTMLRTQMVATAFAVYFTDPALGGNKLNQPVPIGGALISLTNPTNVTAAFGGNTSMTIMGMLQFASTQSNANGTIWYGQNKGLQTTAMTAFDQINNGKIFGP